MYYSGYSQGYMTPCPYCGGMHPPGQCPLMMNPPAGPMPPMGGHLPCMPTPAMPDMAAMHEMMMQHTQMLQHITLRVDEMYKMCKEIYMKMAKG